MYRKVIIRLTSISLAWLVSVDRPRARIRAFFALFAGFWCEPHSLDGFTLIEIPSNGHGIDTAGKRSLLFPQKFYEFDAAGKPVHYSPYVRGYARFGFHRASCLWWQLLWLPHPWNHWNAGCKNGQLCSRQPACPAYIGEIRLNGTKYNSNFLSHSTLTEGATLHFTMCNPIHHHKPENHRPWWKS